jgi:hypothetical protein
MIVCPNGHAVDPEDTFCTRCGAQVVGDAETATPLLPPFEPDRLREAYERTVPLSVLVALVVLAFLVGVALGALS